LEKIPGIKRYKRQILLPEIGRKGQQKLSDSSVFVAGAGGLGAPVLLYLAAAGVGHITLADGDIVSESNLSRQILYKSGDIGLPKAPLAVEALRRLNDNIAIIGYELMLDDQNTPSLIAGHDLIVVCVDSLKSRHVINRAAVAHKIPFVEGAIHGFHGRIMTVFPGETACCECLYDSSIETSGKPVPMLGAMAALVGSMMATLAVRTLVECENPTRGALLMIDAKSMTNERIAINRNPSCPVCGSLNREI
jgi:adenylyltransferase/sulfurtransferase